MDSAERSANIAQMVSDPEALRREVIERAKRDNPNVTDAQLQAMWEQAAQQLGL